MTSLPSSLDGIPPRLLAHQILSHGQANEGSNNVPASASAAASALGSSSATPSSSSYPGQMSPIHEQQEPFIPPLPSRSEPRTILGSTSSPSASNYNYNYPVRSDREREKERERETDVIQDNMTSVSETDPFKENLSIKLDEPVGSMSISPANRDVVLGARKGLFVVDLDNPYDSPRFLPHLATWEVADVQWSPHPSRSSWVVSTSNTKALVWNLSFPTSTSPKQPVPNPTQSSKHPIPTPSRASSPTPIEYVLSAHTRAITDINWSVFDPDVLATCGIDGRVWIWDLRTGGGGRPVNGYCAWNSSATQVKWNRQEKHCLASSHDDRVLIWDDRKGSMPVTTIKAHDTKIYGIDWSRRSDDGIVTCGLDKTVKYWSTKTPDTPRITIQTNSPVWRARHLPFGKGVLTLPQRSETTLRVWARGPPAREIGKFEGHTDVVKEFVWRVRGGLDDSNDDRDFQLVTWSKDRRLRLWQVSDTLLKESGHVRGSSIDVRVTRNRGGIPNISFRQSISYASTGGITAVGPVGMTPPNESSRRGLRAGTGTGSSSAAAIGRSRLSTRSHTPLGSSPSKSLTSGGQGGHQSGGGGGEGGEGGIGGPEPGSSLSSFASASGPSGSEVKEQARRAVSMKPTSRRRGGDNVQAGMGIGGGFMTRGGIRPGGVDRRAWIGGVERLGRADSGNEGGDEGGVGGHHHHHHHHRIDGGVDGGENVHQPSEAARTRSQSRTREGGGAQNLGEELKSVLNSEKFSNSRVNFEEINVAGRSCKIALFAPWEGRAIFLRVLFGFPKSYPSSSPLTVLIEKHADVPHRWRAYLLRKLRSLAIARAKAGKPSFEECIKLLLGERTVGVVGGERSDGVVGTARKDEDDSDDDDDDEEIPTMGGVDPDILRNNQNVPWPWRTGGATFGPNGELVCFFPSVRPSDAFSEITNNLSQTNGTRDRSTSAQPRPRRRLFETFGVLGSMGTRPGEEENEAGENYEESDPELRMPGVVVNPNVRAGARDHSLGGRGGSWVGYDGGATSNNKFVFIKDFSHLIGIDKGLAEECSLRGLPHEICHDTALAVESRGNFLLHRIWDTLATVFHPNLAVPKLDDPGQGVAGPNPLEARASGSVAWLTSMSEQLIMDAISVLKEMRDIQNLAMIACVVLMYKRASDAAKVDARSRTASISEGADYFSARRYGSRLSNSTRSPTSIFAQTPGSAFTYGPVSPFSGHKGSFPNLASTFLNSSFKSATTPPSPGSPFPIRSLQQRHRLPDDRSFPPLKLSPVLPNAVRSLQGSQGHLSRRSSFNASMSRTSSHHNARSQNAPSVTFGGASVIVNSDPSSPAATPRPPPRGKRQIKIQFSLDKKMAHPKPPSPLSGDAFITELQTYVLAYAEILSRWKLDYQRVNLLKIWQPSLSGQASLFRERLQLASGLHEAALGYEPANFTVPKCSMCRTPVNGVAQFCFVCFHGGHYNCMKDWYVAVDACPQGCGCNCIREGGFAGLFAIDKQDFGPGFTVTPAPG